MYEVLNFCENVQKFVLLGVCKVCSKKYVKELLPKQHENI